MPDTPMRFIALYLLQAGDLCVLSFCFPWAAVIISAGSAGRTEADLELSVWAPDLLRGSWER